MAWQSRVQDSTWYGTNGSGGYWLVTFRILTLFSSSISDRSDAENKRDLAQLVPEAILLSYKKEKEKGKVA